MIATYKWISIQNVEETLIKLFIVQSFEKYLYFLKQLHRAKFQRSKAPEISAIYTSLQKVYKSVSAFFPSIIIVVSTPVISPIDIQCCCINLDPWEATVSIYHNKSNFLRLLSSLSFLLPPLFTHTHFSLILPLFCMNSVRFHRSIPCMIFSLTLRRFEIKRQGRHGRCRILRRVHLPPTQSIFLLHLSHSRFFAVLLLLFTTYSGTSTSNRIFLHAWDSYSRGEASSSCPRDDANKNLSCFV